jgi:hypothetical protein
MPMGELRMQRTAFSAEFELAMLKTELGLSEDQAAKIKAVLDQFVAQRQSLSEKEISPDDFDSLRQAEEKKSKEIEEILTEAQKEKYKQIRARMSGRLRWPMPPA